MTGFANQIRWVLLSYVSRPAILVLVSVALLFFMAARFRPEIYVAGYPQFPLGTLRVDSRESLDWVRSQGLQKDVDAMDLGQLRRDYYRRRGSAASHDSESEEPQALGIDAVSEEFPNVRILQWDLHGNDGDISEISKLRQLEYLSITNYTGDSERSLLAAIESLAALRYIELGYSPAPWRGLENLRSLPKLETLVLTSRFSVDDKTLAEIATLPHLERLVLAFQRSDPVSESVTAEGFQVLKDSVSLRDIHVGGYLAQDRDELYPLAQKTLPLGILRPSVVSGGGPSRFLITLLPCLCIAGGIGLQLGTQLLPSTSRAAPRYWQRHLQVAVALLLLLILVGTWQWSLLGAPMVAAIATVACLLVVATSLASVVVANAQLGTSSSLLVGIISGFLGWFNAAIIFLMLLRPTLFDELLLQMPPLLFLALGVITITSVATAWRSLVYAQAVGAPFRAQALSLMAVYERRFRPGRFSWGLKARERSIESFVRQPSAHSFWQTLVHLRRGNPTRIFLQPIAMFFMMWSMMYLIQSLQLRDNTRFRTGQMSLYMAIEMAYLVGVLAVSQIWRSRLAVLSLELQWPLRRSAILKQVAMAAACDMLVPTLILAAGFVIAFRQGLAVSSIIEWILIVAISLSIAATCSAVLLGVLGTIRQTWLVYLLALGITVVVTFPMMFCGVSGRDIGVSPVDPLIATWLIPGWATGVFASIFFWKRWVNREFGLGA